MATNPRYPHQCVIYRKAGATSFNSGETKEVYKGECRKSSSTNIRTFNTGTNATGKVDIADYRVSLPGIVNGIQKGDLIDVTDLIGTETGMRIVMVDATQLGEYETTDENGKTKIIRGGTAVLCNSPSN
ncbi:MAG: hypothetical protein K2M94_04010 [Paramuribaculum sp.]|nr:hypothetical protein [Paramuribaculum sp.]